ncbi:uncharacterized protein LOC111354238 [Spodoptera litura]|uniref:Uncharacterized protein LOC111354238 n=1 Tax=Spodoptera litura TaxID=69820 RepID=A0A9J7E2Q7_SPOLT|nr:uncharacterized protein LOC111354238 [Spodoptera litura]
MSDISYRDISKKDLAWEKIARECEMANGKEAKSHWKKLRDSHREALRRRKTTTGQAAQNMKPWKYENLMEFLLPHRENNETFSNFSDRIQGNDSENTSDTIITDTDVVESPPSPAKTSTIQSGKKNSKQLEMIEILQRREKNREQRRTERDEIRKHITDANRPQDALSHLFESSLPESPRGVGGKFVTVPPTPRGGANPLRF